MKWRELPTPTALGVIAAIAGLAMVFIGANIENVGVVIAGAAILGLLVASAIASYVGVRRVLVERDTTLRGQVGHPVPFRIRVAAPRSPGGFLIAKDRNFGVRPALIPTRGGVYDGSWLLMLTQRGRWSELKTAVACSMPAGLFVAKREFTSQADVEIGPATSEIALPEFLGRVEGPGERKARPPRAGHGIDFLNIREYRPGDRIRHIHWRATARHDELLVREFENEGHTTILVALDSQGAYAPAATAASTTPPLGLGDMLNVTPASPSVSLGDYAGERAVSVAASICLAAIREGNTVFIQAGNQGLFEARSREEAMSYWAKVSFGPYGPITRKLAETPPGAHIAIVGTYNLMPYLSEVPNDASAFVVGAPAWSPVPTWFVPMDGPICFQPQLVAA